MSIASAQNGLQTLPTVEVDFNCVTGDPAYVVASRSQVRGVIVSDTALIYMTDSEGNSCYGLIEERRERTLLISPLTETWRSVVVRR